MTRLAGSDCRERTQQKTSHTLQHGLTSENLAFKEVDLELNAKREINIEPKP